MGWFEDITGYESVGDMASAAGTAISNAVTGEGSNNNASSSNNATSSSWNPPKGDKIHSGPSGNDSEDDTYTIAGDNSGTVYSAITNQPLSSTSPAQSDVNKLLAAMNTGSDSVIADVDDSGNRTGEFQVYDSKGNLRTDVTDKEIKYYLDNPDTTISEEDYKTGQKTARIIGLFSKTLGIGYAGILKLQQQGYIPSGGTYPEGTPEFGDNDRDTKLNAILDNGELSEEDKKAQVNALITAGLTDYAASNASQLGLDQVKPLVESIFSDTSTTDPLVAAKSMVDGAMISDSYTGVDANATGTNLDPTKYIDDGERPSVDVAKSAINTLDEVKQSAEAVSYSADSVSGELDNADNQAEAIIGEVGDKSLVEAEQIDMAGAYSGVNADGSKNYVGEALNDAATIKLSNVIDTSTTEGKLLADKLGEGNYVDAKATLLGQMEILSESFKDSNGDPRIPVWAQATAREVSRTLGAGYLGGGTAAMAAMSNALLEASLPIAEGEAKFFQTLTEKNLDNRQQTFINKANALANFETTNLDARMTAAVQNAQAFLETDLKNLDNRQQVEIVNINNRIDALFEDQKATNAERLFAAESKNDFAKYYDGLRATAEIHRNEQINLMERSNTSEINAARQFNATIDAEFERFYKDMQFNVDLATTKWRQTIEVENTKLAFEAAKFDVETLLEISSEALNRVWNREDSNLDYAWKSTNNILDRQVETYKADRGYDLQADELKFNQNKAESAGTMEVIDFILRDSNPLQDFKDILDEYGIS